MVTGLHPDPLAVLGEGKGRERKRLGTGKEGKGVKKLSRKGREGEDKVT